MSEQLSLGVFPLLPPVVTAPPEPEAVDEFEQWWERYPRKVAKAEARKAWATMRKRVPFATLMDGLLAYRFSAEASFVPHAATWLRGERWLDAKREQELLADPWGLQEWLSAQPAPADDALFSVHGYDIEALVEIMEATRLAPTWRGSLALLGEWLCAGYRPDSIAEVVADGAARLVGPPTGLLVFDRGVRRRALHWNAARQEWQRWSTA